MFKKLLSSLRAFFTPKKAVDSLHEPVNKDFNSYINNILSSNNVSRKDNVSLIVSRGYYAEKGNKRGVYDDLLVWVYPDGFKSYRGNADPNVHRQGIATLKAGVWKYQPGPHPLSPPNYPAYRQAAPVTVHRDGQKDDTGWFGINVHQGGINSTSSIGCITTQFKDWHDFKSFGDSKLGQYRKKTFPLIVVDHVNE